MNIEAVIGANYGDEGKGLFTEYLCRNRKNPIVAMSNGGCQRGHTVDNKEKNIRHIFQHFGSGTIIGVPTIFSNTYLLNPIQYVSERKELISLGISPKKTFIAPSCIVQFPSDMFVNQTIEKARGKNKHGSCGWGIWETIVRNRDFRKWTFAEYIVLSDEMKRNVLLDTVNWQLENRLCDFKNAIDNEILNSIVSDEFISHFISDVKEMTSNSIMLDTDNLLEVDWTKYGIEVDTLIVENGQGLLLDKEYAPIDENGRTDIHTTPSNCGIKGVITALGDFDYEITINANYITRTYFTRHGSGPFPEYDYSLTFIDKTNKPNDYQDSLRFGHMAKDDAYELWNRVNRDFRLAENAKGTISVIATHCNEVYPNSILKKYATHYSYEDDSRKII